MYAFMLLLVTIIGWIMTLHDVSEWLQTKVPFCWSKIPLLDNAKNVLNSKFFEENNAKKNICEEFTGFLAVYRLMFATFVFFILLGFIMLRVRHNRDPRVSFHKGFWPIKFILLILAIIGAFYIPSDSAFSDVWKYFGFIGSFLYLLIQVCFLTIFADEWADNWVQKMEDGKNGNCPFISLILVSVCNFVLTFIGLILFYTYYGGDGCHLHKFIISINLIIICVLCLVSITPKVQEYRPRSGLLQASIIAVYLTYMTWSALNSSPNDQCKPEIWSRTSSTSIDWQSFISLMICFACVCYSSFRMSSQEGVQRITGVSTEEGDDREADDDSDNYSGWPYFYWFLALGTLYLMMTLTNWFTPSETYEKFGQSNSSMWIKVISCWFSALIYLWTLVAPILLGEYRDFS